jgi:hypothetical protein
VVALGLPRSTFAPLEEAPRLFPNTTFPQCCKSTGTGIVYAPMPTVQRRQLLTRCKPWPTQHTLPTVVLDLLDQLAAELTSHGRKTARQDVLAAIVVHCAPDRAEALVALLRRPHPALGGPALALPPGHANGRVASGNQQILMRLPSPVTRKLDYLLDIVQHAGYSLTRRQLVCALVVHKRPAPGRANFRLYTRYCNTEARQAAVAGRPLAAVLSLERLPPGRRPMPRP